MTQVKVHKYIINNTIQKVNINTTNSLHNLLLFDTHT